MSKVTLKSDALTEKRLFPYERRRIPKKLRGYAENVGVVTKMSKVKLKSDALAEKSSFPYERRRIPKNYVFRLKKWAWSQKCPKRHKKVTH